MLKNTLLNIPQIVLLRSDKLFNKLISEILDNSENIYKSNFDEIFSGVRDFYPNSYRLDEMELSLSQEDMQNCGISNDIDFKKFDGIDYDFSFLDTVFDDFFDTSGSKIFAKEENLENYLRFITKVSPIQIIGYKLSCNFKDKTIELNDLKSFVSSYKPLGLEVDELNSYAENHLHLKGAHYISFNMFKLFSQTTHKDYFDKKFLKKIPRINEFSFINNHTYSIGQIVEILKLSVDFIYGSFMDDEKNHIDRYQESLHKILITNKVVKTNYRYSIENISKMEKLFPIFKNNIKDDIVREIVKCYKEDRYSQAYLLENTLFFYMYQKRECNYVKLFIKLYFQASNILRSYMVQSQNLGLAHFSEYSGSYIRNIDRKNAHSIASSIINSGTDYLNAKMDLKDDSSYINGVLEDFKYAFDSKDKKIKYNFGLSSKKGREKDSKIQTGDLLPRYYKKRKMIKEEAIALDDFLRNVKYKKLNKYKHKLKYLQIKALKNKQKLKNKTYDMSSLIVSIDAVGKETHTPPEIFAPFFRYLRVQPKKLKNNIFKDIKEFKHHPKLLITVHAGEDFNHIITGMRRVDESIKFFDMQRRDRLGHVLSLGMAPKLWIESVKDILMYKGDYLDDLVWLIIQLKKFSHKGLYINRFIGIYEDKLWKLFREIYPSCVHRNLHITDIYEAWEYRKNCTITYYKNERKNTLFDDYSNAVIDDMPNDTAKRIFELYQTDKVVREKSKEVINIDKTDISKEEQNIWEALQDYMINEISTKGIIIETNPSSNVFVSSLNSYEYHPIFRFYPPKKEMLDDTNRFNKYNLRDGIVDVTINSDDPAIFVTSLQNEYKAIKNTAIQKYKCSSKEAEDWIDDIRKFGVKIFKESYIESD